MVQSGRPEWSEQKRKACKKQVAKGAKANGRKVTNRRVGKGGCLI